MARAVVKQAGERVLLIIDGRLRADLPHQSALALGRALIAQARRAEELAHAERIAGDQALLLRVGAPLGLTCHPRIQAEAGNRAAWDRDLRRALPGGVRSTEHVGTPGIVQYPPPETST